MIPVATDIPTQVPSHGYYLRPRRFRDFMSEHFGHRVKGARKDFWNMARAGKGMLPDAVINLPPVSLSYQ